MRPDFVGLGGFDSHTLPPRVLLIVLALLVLPANARAQDTTVVTARTAGVERAPVSPGRAFLQSLIIPGLAQSRLDRPTGVLFVATELIAVTMYAKSSYDYQLARRFSRDSVPLNYTTDPTTGLPGRDPVTNELVVKDWSRARYSEGKVRARRSHVEDWVALIVFNHLFSGADAFISAQLWDLPGKVELRVAPRGSRLGWQLPW